MTNFAGIDPNGSLSYLLEKPAPKTPDNSLGKDAFLKLLIAQLKYQDPTQPADSTQFISQTAQFTVVEKLEELSKHNAELLASQRAMSSTSFVGRFVRWESNATDEVGSPNSGTVTGVRLTSGGPILLVDEWEVPMHRITTVLDRAPTIPTSGTTPPPVGGGTPPPDTGTTTDETAPTDGAATTTGESAGGTDTQTGPAPGPDTTTPVV